MLPICRKKNHSEKSFNDLVIKDALKDTIARVFSRSSQIPIIIGNKYTYIKKKIYIYI